MNMLELMALYYILHEQRQTVAIYVCKNEKHNIDLRDPARWFDIQQCKSRDIKFNISVMGKITWAIYRGYPAKRTLPAMLTHGG